MRRALRAVARARFVRHGARRLLRGRTAHRVARRLMRTPAGPALERYAEKTGRAGGLRRLLSERLPAGRYYARLTLHDWEPLLGQDIVLMQGDLPVYGNRVEAPARGFPLEYRNIIVSSDDPRAFRLVGAARYTLTFSHGAFTTPQQVTYDERYGVRRDGDVSYSLRGGTTPRKLIVTFPGFGPSTSRVSYGISYLQDLGADDLRDALVLAFQDRYLAAGSYMYVDSGGRPLRARVERVIADVMARHGIAPSDVLFFGASKGGSTALYYARRFREARILVAVPQTDLPYYLSKPFFRNGLLRETALHEDEQPQALLRRYLAEGRTVDYLYSDDDESSNYSFIECAEGYPTLTKYRVGGPHAQVTRAALPTILALIREFLHGAAVEPVRVDGVRTFEQGSVLRLQVRLRGDDLPAGGNAYVGADLGGTTFLQMLSAHDLPFVRFMDDTQWLSPDRDPVDGIDRLVLLGGGTRREGALVLPRPPGGRRARLALPASPLVLGVPRWAEYAVVDGQRSAVFAYASRAHDPECGESELHLVDPADQADLAGLLAPRDGRSTRHTVVVRAAADSPCLDVLVRRVAVASGAPRLRVQLAEGDLDPAARDRLEALDPGGISVTCRRGPGAVVVRPGPARSVSAHRAGDP